MASNVPKHLQHGNYKSFPRSEPITNFFISPNDTGGNGKDNLVYIVGSVLSLSWSTNLTTVDLELYQRLGSVLDCIDCINGPHNIGSRLTGQRYNWTVDTGFLSLVEGNTFYITVHDSNLSIDEDKSQFNSSSFNLTTDLVANTTRSTTTSSSISPGSTSDSSLGLSTRTSSLNTGGPTATVTSVSVYTPLVIIHTADELTNTPWYITKTVSTTSIPTRYTTATLSTTISTSISPTPPPPSTPLTITPTPIPTTVPALPSAAKVAGIPRPAFIGLMSIPALILPIAILLALFLIRRNSKLRHQKLKTSPPIPFGEVPRLPEIRRVSFFASDRQIPELGDEDVGARKERERIERRMGVFELP
ncbi:hypothetical protein BGZ60DRAFT_530948 [Tricladium varicosporioides]|nr:hypothetical protein BGZ60DRAFT_530948 [Hymenoscyphus varicosporioides]